MTISAGADILASDFISTSGGVSDAGKGVLLNAKGRLDKSVIASFGGDGSDGALTVTSGTTNINLGGLALVVKNYTSISITGSGAVTFSNPHANGTIILLRSQGDVTLTSSTIPNLDASGMGAAGGTGGAASSSGSSPGNNVGTAGNLPTNYLGTDTNPIGAGGQQSTPSAAASAYSVPYLYTLTDVALFRKTVVVAPGAGGGGGSGGNVQSGTGSDGGNGGNGGGALMIECGGTLNFTSTLGIDVSGKNGSNGANSPANTGLNTASAAGGGGGAAGMCVILYNYLTAASGTVNAKGGNGGNGGSCSHSASGSGGNNRGWGLGGGGAASYSAAGGTTSNNTIGANGTNGSAGSGAGGGNGTSLDYNVSGTNSGGTGGTGGTTSTGLWVISKNYFFA